MITQAINNLNPALKFTISGEVENQADYNNIQWYVGVDENNTAIPGLPDNVPAWEDVEEEIERLNTEYASLEYQRERKKAYPDLGDQFDMLYHAIDQGALDKTCDFFLTLKAVKDANLPEQG